MTSDRSNFQVKLAPVAPWDQGAPAIQGPAIHGASAGKPLFYAVPATGERPIRFSADGLPEGLAINPATGHIAGTVKQEGDTRVRLSAENRHGKAEKEFVIAIGRGVALTPPLGWNSWNAWRRWVSDDTIRAAADALVSTGLAARGYQYVNIDSCWQGARGGRHGAIQPNRKFPDMTALADYVHGRGLKLGIYSTPWTVPWGCEEKEAVADWGGPGLIGCSSGEPDPDRPRDYFFHMGKFVGQEKHEAQDVAQWVEWGIDYLKYDWTPTDPVSLERMGRTIRAASRDFVLSICTDARLKHIDVYKKWAQMWRGTGDTADRWPNIVHNGFLADDVNQEDWRPHIGPGGWHDLDMFALGPQFHTATSSCPNKLTPDEQLVHMTAWALYPSPMILSCDLTALNDFELRLFGNEEVIAVNQDRLGKPAMRLREERCQRPSEDGAHRNSRIWARPLDGGEWAVGLFNLAEHADALSIELSDIGVSGPVKARNLWERRDWGRIEGRLSIAVPAHGAQLIRIGR